jgi:hypothetical protein
MSDAPPMRTRRTPVRVPGFPPAVGEVDEATVVSSAPSAPRAPQHLNPRDGTRQLNVRVLAPLLARYKRLVRDLDDEGFETSVTEIVHALLLAGPDSCEEARQAVRGWRRALDPEA